MDTETSKKEAKTVHQGRNVKRFREMLNIKQYDLAEKIGTSQQTISRIEQEEIIDEKQLHKIAEVLQISEDAFKKWDNEMAVNIISSTFNDQAIAYQNNVNPIDKITELYERLLSEKQESINLLEKLFDHQSK